MAINHGNLYITLLALVLRALWSTHAEVNGAEEEKGENRDGNGKGRPAGAERGRERRKGRCAQAGGGSGGSGEKRILLVGDV